MKIRQKRIHRFNVNLNDDETELFNIVWLCCIKILKKELF